MAGTDRANDLAKINAISASRRNAIAYAVSCKVSRHDLLLESAAEERYYAILMEEAREHERKYGFWPTFEMEEIDYTDESLDIYASEPDRMTWGEETHG